MDRRSSRYTNIALARRRLGGAPRSHHSADGKHQDRTHRPAHPRQPRCGVCLRPGPVDHVACGAASEMRAPAWITSSPTRRCRRCLAGFPGARSGEPEGSQRADRGQRLCVLLDLIARIALEGSVGKGRAGVRSRRSTCLSLTAWAWRVMTCAFKKTPRAACADPTACTAQPRHAQMGTNPACRSRTSKVLAIASLC
jgi:hypothetical protein